MLYKCPGGFTDDLRTVLRHCLRQNLKPCLGINLNTIFVNSPPAFTLIYFTGLENVGHLAEDHHRCLNTSVQLAHPADAAGYRRDVAQDLRVVLVLLVDGRHRLDLRLERLDDDFPVVLKSLDQTGVETNIFVLVSVSVLWPKVCAGSRGHKGRLVFAPEVTILVSTGTEAQIMVSVSVLVSRIWLRGRSHSLDLDLKDLVLFNIRGSCLFFS